MTRRTAIVLLAAVACAAGPVQLAAQPTRPASRPADWANAPLSPGGWTYRTGTNARSQATFGRPGAPVLEIACTNGGIVALFRHGARAGQMVVRTSSTLKETSGNALAAGLSVPLPVGDPILDAMAFSRGRFAIETPGVASLVVPAWPELARVVEDCRR